MTTDHYCRLVKKSPLGKEGFYVRASEHVVDILVNSEYAVRVASDEVDYKKFFELPDDMFEENTHLFKVEIKKEEQKEKKEKKKQKEEEKPKQISWYDDGENLYEQVLTEQNEYKFCKYNKLTKQVTYVDVIMVGDIMYMPVSDSEVLEKQIKLPSKVEHYGDEKQLIQDIDAFIDTYVDVRKEFREYAILNILKSWVYDRFHTISYLRFQGEPGKGKSRALDVFGYLHYKPIATSGTVTAAPIYRLITKWHGTLIIDEADRRQSDETDEVIKIINQGFEKGRCVLRCDPINKTEVQFFDTYCPKVLSTRHAFEDVATETRCMTEIMTGTRRKNIISSLNGVFWKDMQVLRNKLLLWRFHNYDAINPDEGETMDWTGIEPRLKQTNVGYIPLIRNNPELLESFMNQVRLRQAALVNERSESVEGLIVEAIAQLLTVDTETITAEKIIEKAGLVDKYNNKWKARRLSSYMKTLGFGNAELKRDGDEVIRRYNIQPEVFATLYTTYADEKSISAWIEVGQRNTLSNPNFCNFVTIVTIVTGRGCLGKMDENKKEEGAPHRIVTNVTNVTTQNLSSEKNVTIANDVKNASVTPLQHHPNYKCQECGANGCKVLHPKPLCSDCALNQEVI